MQKSLDALERGTQPLRLKLSTASDVDVNDVLFASKGACACVCVRVCACACVCVRVCAHRLQGRLTLCGFIHSLPFSLDLFFASVCFLPFDLFFRARCFAWCMQTC